MFACLFRAFFFLLNGQLLKMIFENPLVSVTATKYRDLTLARESSDYDVLLFQVRKLFVP